MSSLRVLQLGTSGPLYGAERWILALVRNLDPALIESHVAVIADQPGAPVPLRDEAERLGYAAHTIAAPGRFNPEAVRALRRLISDQAIDVVHSHGYKADAIALLAACGTGARTLATPHGWSHNAGPKLRLFEWLDRQAFRFFDAIAPLSPDLAAGIAPIGTVAARTRLIPNGVDLIEVDATGPVPAELAALKQRGPVIGYTGQLIARKNLDTLLDGFAAWGDARASLVMVGEGDARQALHARAAALGLADRVHFAGFRSDRLEWMRGFDLFVLPSLVEGIPRCLMEAMALRVPVIASDIPGNRELVIPGETGRLFEPTDARALTSALDLARDPQAMALFAANGRARIEAHHSGAAMARAYASLFAEMCAAA